MKPKLKNPVSDVVHGAFILSVMKTVKEVDTMCQPKCSECHRELTDDEIFILEAQGIKMSKDEIVCFIGKNAYGKKNCQDQLMQQRLEESRHPDDRG